MTMRPERRRLGKGDKYYWRFLEKRRRWGGGADKIPREITKERHLTDVGKTIPKKRP